MCFIFAYVFSSSFQFSKEKLISFISHEGFIVFQILLLSSLLIFFLWRGVALWRIAVVLVIGSVAWTWIHLYKVALSKKQATLSRLGETPQRCLVEKQGWAAAFKGAWYSALGEIQSFHLHVFENCTPSFIDSISGIQDNKCEAYYEALMVDPFWEITPLKAITETASQFVLRPLEVLGSSIGIFFSGILEPIPIFWKIPVLIVGLIVIVLLLLMGCRYVWTTYYRIKKV